MNIPNIVTHFTNNRKCIDKQNNRLKPKAFIHPNKSEVSVVDIDEELTQPNRDELIFAIGNLIYTGEQKVKARGDMLVVDIENIKYGENDELSVYLEYASTDIIPKHYNIKPSFEDLDFANKCAHHLSRISRLVLFQAA